MGMVLLPTVAMGGWNVEVDMASAYLAGTGFLDYAYGYDPEPRHVPRVLRHATEPSDGTDTTSTAIEETGVAFAIPVEDARQVLAAVDQVIDHVAYRMFAVLHSDALVTGEWSLPCGATD